MKRKLHKKKDWINRYIHKCTLNQIIASEVDFTKRKKFIEKCIKNISKSIKLDCLHLQHATYKLVSEGNIDMIFRNEFFSEFNIREHHACWSIEIININVCKSREQNAHEISPDFKLVMKINKIDHLKVLARVLS